MVLPELLPLRCLVLVRECLVVPSRLVGMWDEGWGVVMMMKWTIVVVVLFYLLFVRSWRFYSTRRGVGLGVSFSCDITCHYIHTYRSRHTYKDERTHASSASIFSSFPPLIGFPFEWLSSEMWFAAFFCRILLGVYYGSSLFVSLLYFSRNLQVSSTQPSPLVLTHRLFLLVLHLCCRSVQFLKYCIGSRWGLWVSCYSSI